MSKLNKLLLSVCGMLLLGTFGARLILLPPLDWWECFMIGAILAEAQLLIGGIAIKVWKV